MIIVLPYIPIGTILFLLVIVGGLSVLAKKEDNKKNTMALRYKRMK